MREKAQCPICGRDDVQKVSADQKELSYRYKDYFYYECPRCGNFFISDQLDRNLAQEEKPLSLISSWIREQNEIGKEVSLATDVYERLKKDLRMPSISEKQLKLMQAFERRTHHPGEWIKLDEAFIALGWCENYEELCFLIKALEERNLIKGRSPIPVKELKIPTEICIAVSGWDFLDENKQKGPGIQEKPL